MKCPIFLLYLELDHTNGVKLYVGYSFLFNSSQGWNRRILVEIPYLFNKDPATVYLIGESTFVQLTAPMEIVQKFLTYSRSICWQWRHGMLIALEFVKKTLAWIYPSVLFYLLSINKLSLVSPKPHMNYLIDCSPAMNSMTWSAVTKPSVDLSTNWYSLSGTCKGGRDHQHQKSINLIPQR